MSTNLYATDGKCHNANHGTYGHECGKPAEWIGHQPSGFASGFCSRCKAEGDEARAIVRWEPITPKATRKARPSYNLTQERYETAWREKQRLR